MNYSIQVVAEATGAIMHAVQQNKPFHFDIY